MVRGTQLSKPHALDHVDETIFSQAAVLTIPSKIKEDREVNPNIELTLATPV